MGRTILHSDCNCFYASVEMLHHPETRNVPMAVGGDPEARHGIVLTANYIAKRMGVKTGMALWQARQVCPQIVFISPHYDQYIRFSRYAREIYSSFTDLQEPFGLDECWLDVTESTSIKGDGLKIAEEISNRIKKELGITVSIGVSWNKILETCSMLAAQHRENWGSWGSLPSGILRKAIRRYCIPISERSDMCCTPMRTAGTMILSVRKDMRHR